MLFNSFEFLIFLVVVYAAYRVLPFRAQNWMLLVASYVFYGWWDWRFLFLMILSTSIDYWTGLVLDRGKLTRRQMAIPAVFLSSAALLLLGTDFSAVLHRIGGAETGPLLSDLMPRVALAIPLAALVLGGIYHLLVRLPEDKRRKACLLVSIVVQLSILGFFKYFNFFIDSLVASLNAAGVAAEPRHFDIVLPVGISFYTFQSMSYAIDIYRRELKPTDRYLDFALFVAFFPQLVAGPIERARNLLPQMMSPRTITYEQTTRGLFLIMFGLFKKIAIADGVGGTVDGIFGSTGTLTWADVAVGTVLFAIQIYTDFSGYSDIARGTAKLFGVELIVNFNQPYFAKSPREFWQRWHISLSRWLGDYLYRPLGGNGGTLAFTVRNMMITMVLGGLWHGAAWNFVLWGFYNGALIAIQRCLFVWRGNRPMRETFYTLIFMFAGNALLTLYGRMLFRAESLGQVGDFTRILLTFDGGLDYGGGLPRMSAAGGILLLVLWEVVQYRRGGNDKFYRALPLPLTGLAIASMIFLTFMGLSNAPAQFIYFQF